MVTSVSGELFNKGAKKVQEKLRKFEEENETYPIYSALFLMDE